MSRPSGDDLEMKKGENVNSNINESLQKETGRGDAGTWREVWMFPFRALRGFYWLLDPNAKCRSVVLQTVGRVEKKESEEHRDAETGSVYYTHYVTYAYEADGRSRTDRKKVGDLGELRKGTSIRVYYLPDRYGRDGSRLRSAIDFNPRPMPVSARKELAETRNGSESR